MFRCGGTNIDGDALPSDVRVGKTFYSDNVHDKKVGTYNPLVFVAWGSDYNHREGAKRVPVRGHNEDYVSVENNVITFKKRCTVFLTGGHGSTGSSGPQGGSANTSYDGSKGGTFTSGFSGYNNQVWNNSILLNFEAGDNFVFESYGSNSGDYSASIIAYFNMYATER